MRRLFTSFVVAAIAAVAPAMALAGNQEVAEEIANRLRNSGQMSDYKVGVKYQDGTAWLRGRVASQEQMETALRLVFRTQRVDRVVNQLAIAPSQPARTVAPRRNPLRDRSEPAGVRQSSIAGRMVSHQPRPLPIGHNDPAYANRLESSYNQSGVRPVSAQEPQELPRQAAASRPVARVAMNQAEMYGQPVPNGQPRPMYMASSCCANAAPARYDQPCMPNYAWPSYASYPNYAALTYPKQYSPTAWPYIGPFYPYPQVPMGWRKVTLQWDDGWWFLDFSDQPASCWQR